MIPPPKKNPSDKEIFMSIVAAGGSHYIQVTWESSSPALSVSERSFCISKRSSPSLRVFKRSFRVSKLYCLSKIQ